MTDCNCTCNRKLVELSPADREILRQIGRLRAQPDKPAADSPQDVADRVELALDSRRGGYIPINPDDLRALIAAVRAG